MVDVAREMERRGLDAAAADRRRDDVAPAHGGRRSRPSTGSRSCTCTTRRARSASSPTCSIRRGASGSTRENRELQERLRAAARGARPQAAAAARAGARRTGTASPFDDAARAGVRRRAASSSRTLETLREYIDWQFFFHAWELKGALPGDPRAARGARAVRRRAASCSTRSSATGCSRARGVYGFWPAASDGDDIVVQ